MNTPDSIYKLFAVGIFVDPMVDAASLRSTARTIRPRRSNFNLVRIAADHDGRSLAQSDLDGLVACFSPSVDCTASLEIHLDALGDPSS